MLLARRWREVQARLDEVRAEWRETVAMASPGLPVDDDSHRRHLASIRSEMTGAFDAVDDWPESLSALLDDWRFEPLWPHLLVRLSRHAKHRATAVERALSRYADDLEVGEGFATHAARHEDPTLFDAGSTILAAAAASSPTEDVAACATRLLALAEAAEGDAIRRRIVEALAGMRAALASIDQARGALERAAH